MGELKVYYGWAKIGKIRKKRAISVMFENEWNGCRSERGQRILIHVSKTTDENGWEALTREQLFKVIPYEKKLFGNKKELPHGDIIGSVVIADCVQNHPSVWAEKGCWNWVLKDAVLFDKPIMNVKGKLSFWEYNLED